MTWEAVFILAMPALGLGFIIWMIASGRAKTDWNPRPDVSNPYPERLSKGARWFVGLASALLYIVLALVASPFIAAAAFAAILAFDAICVIIWTTGQELIFSYKGPKIDPESGAIVPRTSYLTRLFRNFRDFYARIVLEIIPNG